MILRCYYEKLICITFLFASKLSCEKENLRGIDWAESESTKSCRRRKTRISEIEKVCIVQSFTPTTTKINIENGNQIEKESFKVRVETGCQWKCKASLAFGCVLSFLNLHVNWRNTESKAKRKNLFMYKKFNISIWNNIKRDECCNVPERCQIPSCSYDSHRSHRDDKNSDSP